MIEPRGTGLKIALTYACGTAPRDRLTFKSFFVFLAIQSIRSKMVTSTKKTFESYVTYDMYFTDSRQILLVPRKNSFLTGRFANFAHKSKSSGCKSLKWRWKPLKPLCYVVRGLWRRFTKAENVHNVFPLADSDFFFEKKLRKTFSLVCSRLGNSWFVFWRNKEKKI